jgi:hypothetical protein
MALDCLYTTVRNISGATRYFDYLPPHGRRLADDEEMSVPAELLPWMNRCGINMRKLRGFAADLTACNIAIVQTPQQHVHVVGEEGDLDVFRTVTIHRDPATDEDVVVAVAPCWECDEDASPSPTA